MAAPWGDGVAEIKKIATEECISWRKIVVSHDDRHVHGGSWQVWRQILAVPPFFLNVEGHFGDFEGC